MNTLVITTAIDSGNGQIYRHLAKMCVASLQRTGFSGDIAIFGVSEIPVFLQEKKGVDEYVIGEAPDTEPARQSLCVEAFSAAGEALDLTAYENVLYLAPDTIVLRNIDHFFDGAGDFCYQPVAGGQWDPGVFGVATHCYQEVVDALVTKTRGKTGGKSDVSGDRQDVGCALTFVEDLPVIASSYRATKFEAGEITYLSGDGRGFPHTGERGALLRLGEVPEVAKEEVAFGVFMQRFFWDKTGILLHLLES